MFHDPVTLGALLAAQKESDEMNITIEGKLFTLTQKEEACEFICRISDESRRIQLLKEAVNLETQLGTFFWTQRGLTSPSLTSGTLEVLNNALTAELRIQPFKQFLKGLKSEYPCQKTALPIIQTLMAKHAEIDPMVFKCTSILVEYTTFLTSLLNGAPQADSEAVSQDLLNLLERITATARQCGSVQINEGLNLGDFIIRYAPEYFMRYLELIKILLDKRPNDLDFFRKVMNLFISNESQSFISRTLAFWGNLAVIKREDKRMPDINCAMYYYMEFVTKQFENMPKSDRQDQSAKDVFKKLLANDFYRLFRCLDISPYRLVITLLRENFFTYTNSQSALKAIMSDGYHDAGYHPKVILIGCLLKIVKELEKEEGGQAKQISLLEDAINPSTDLGCVSWHARDTASCGLRRGTLKDLIKRLAAIQGLSEEHVTGNMELKYGNDTAFNVKANQVVRWFVNSLFFRGTPRPREEAPVEMVVFVPPDPKM